MDETEHHDFIESLTDTVEDILSNSEPLFYHHYHFDDYVRQESYLHFQSIMDDDEFEKKYNACIEDIFLNKKITKRSFLESDHRFDHSKDYSEHIQYLKDIPQPTQRTPEWYAFRKNHLTGSNAWKAFGTQSSKNQLICEKLEPPDPTKSYNNLSESPLNWGHKYEPLSILFYEHFNDVVVEEFGCIPHASIPFLAASPDGIVTSRKNNGRMVEIKNVVSREITKIPKMEYYIQMQVQMEVCNLPDCDFVETKFIEYENEKAFREDKYELKKGMIMVLIKDNSSYIYEYSPLFKNHEKELDSFCDSIFQKYNLDNPQEEENGVRWFRNIYWKLDTFSCVYVPRNEKWFAGALVEMDTLWKIIESEKANTDAYLKYKPKKQNKNTEKSCKMMEVHL